MIAFWLAVHLGKLDFAQFTYNLDPIVEGVVNNVMLFGGEALKLKHAKDVEDLKKKSRVSMLTTYFQKMSE